MSQNKFCGLLKIIEDPNIDKIYLLAKNNVEFVGLGKSASIQLGVGDPSKDLIYLFLITDVCGFTSVLMNSAAYPLFINNKIVNKKCLLNCGDLIEVGGYLMVYEDKIIPDYLVTPQEACGHFIFHCLDDCESSTIIVHKNRTYSFGTGKVSSFNVQTSSAQLRPFHFQVVIDNNGRATLINNNFCEPMLVNKRKMRTGDQFGEEIKINIFNEMIFEYKRNAAKICWGSFMAKSKKQKYRVNKMSKTKQGDKKHKKNAEFSISDCLKELKNLQIGLATKK